MCPAAESIPKGLPNKVKQKRREWIPLSHPTFIPKERAHHAIDGDSSLTSRDKLDSVMNVPFFKSFAPKNFSHEIPINSVVGFLEVKFK
jgi:hypothetical protein